MSIQGFKPSGVKWRLRLKLDEFPTSRFPTTSADPSGDHVISDMVMPKMTGDKLDAHLLHTWPDLPANILLMKK
jgi:CheY-like chemotaxis protein